MIDFKKVLSIVGIVLLVSGCGRNSQSASGNTTSSEDSSEITTSTELEGPTELIPPVGEVRKLFDHGVAGEDRYYNYCPSIFIENNKQYVYYCTNKKEGNVTDYVGYREGTIQNDEAKYSNLEYVLEHGDPNLGRWDSRHACDPSVIKGEFIFHNEKYFYMMAYLGCITSDTSLNETGIAVSKTPRGPWVKCDYKTDGTTKINPIVPYADFGITAPHWGTGQPSLISVDGKGRVLIFTTIGSATGTFTNIREYDFSNIDEYDKTASKIRERTKITTVGVRYSKQSFDIINNADFAYDAERRRILMVKGRQPFGLDNKNPDFVADTLDVYYIDDTEGTEVGDVLFAGNNTEMQWKLIGTIDKNTTGFLRNHNAGLITDEYGHVINNGRIGVAFTRSDEGQTSNWSYLSTYRIYATSLTYNK